jgi:hypothetical protein
VLLYRDKSTAGGATTDSIAMAASNCIHLVKVIIFHLTSYLLKPNSSSFENLVMQRNLLFWEEK